MKLITDRSEIQLFLTIFPFFFPLGFMENTIFEYIWYAYLLVVMALSVLDILLNFDADDFKPSWKLALFWGLYLLVQCCSTASNNGRVWYCAFKVVYLILLTLIIQENLNDNPDELLLTLDRILGFICILSTLCNLFGITGPYGNYVTVYIAMPVWVVVRAIRKQRDGSINTLLPAIIAIVSVLSTIIYAQTGIYGDSSFEWTYFVELILVFIPYFLWQFRDTLKRVFNIHVVYIVIIAINVFFVFLQIDQNIPALNFILVNIMHKDSTFSGRSGIWHMALSIAEKRPWLGYGDSMIGFKSDGTYWNNFIMTNGAHNQFIETILFGGIFSLAFYLVPFIFAWNSLRKSKSDISWLIGMGLFAILIEFTFVYRNLLMCTPFFILMILALNTEKLSDPLHNDNTEVQKIEEIIE